MYETYCALRLERFNNPRFSNQFEIHSIGDFKYFECKSLDIKIFNLFIYSIVWRISISENYAFRGFKLAFPEEEKLRLLLKNYTQSNQEELKNVLIHLNELPDHSHVIIRPKVKVRPPTSMYSAASYNDYLHQVHLVDYLHIYNTKRELLTDRLSLIDNNRPNGLVRVGIVEKERWKSFNTEMVKEAIKQ